MTEIRLLFEWEKKLFEVTLAEVSSVLVHGFRLTFNRFAKGDIETLKPYSRYPQGLTPEQSAQLLRHYGQDSFLRLPPGEGKQAGSALP